MKKTNKTTISQPSKTLLIQKAGGDELKIVLPEGARITFGPTIPGKKSGVQGYSNDAVSGYSLRVYADKTNDSLIAVFCDVRSFRDITMPCSKLVLREAGKSVWKSDEDGYKVEREVKREAAFEDLKLLES